MHFLLYMAFWVVYKNNKILCLTSFSFSCLKLYFVISCDLYFAIIVFEINCEGLKSYWSDIYIMIIICST